MEEVKEGQLRVWHIPQVPMKPFRVPVPNLEAAYLVLNALADYDLFQFENRIKPDYTNMSGLEVFTTNEDLCDGEPSAWVEWADDETGDDVFEHFSKELADGSVQKPV